MSQPLFLILFDMSGLFVRSFERVALTQLAFQTPSVAPASLRFPASLADRPILRVSAFAGMQLTLSQLPLL
jgi:hypothetical protein